MRCYSYRSIDYTLILFVSVTPRTFNRSPHGNWIALHALICSMKRKAATETGKKSLKVRGKSRSKPQSDEEDSSPDTVFIPKVPTPDAGNVEYVDDCLHPNTLDFLKGRLHY